MLRDINRTTTLLFCALFFSVATLAKADGDDSVRRVVAVQQVQIEDLRTQLAQARAAITTLERQVSTLEMNVDDLAGVTNGHTSALRDMNARLTTLERSETVAGLAARVSALESTTSGLASKQEANWAAGLHSSFRTHPIAYFVPGTQGESCTSKCERYDGACVNAFAFQTGEVKGCESDSNSARKCLCAKKP
jgi:septal ring factor EnvC (AmiA/AmiB activator)